MRIPPTTQSPMTDRHVRFTDPGITRQHSMTETQMAVISIPDLHTARMERTIRNTPVAPARPPAPQEFSKPAKIYKRTCDTISLLSGVAALPTLALGFIHPVWLAVPAGLVVTSIVTFLLRGKPTPEMEQEYAARRAAAQNNDCSGV